MKKFCECRVFLIICFLLVWIIEIYKSFLNNSTIINNKSFECVVVMAFIVSVVLLAFFSPYFKKIHYAKTVILLTFSISTILILHESIYFYLPWNHNEQFIVSECILIYLSFFSLLLLLFISIKKALNK